eukprot:SAG31_NODE_348_length_17296_cov_5.089482_13_plen_305_part_00
MSSVNWISSLHSSAALSLLLTILVLCCPVQYWGQSPEWWLLETSGLPFGLTGDMIREGTVGVPTGQHPNGGCASTGCVPTKGKGCPDPNRWLGMVFGMGTRLAWGGLGTNMSAVLASPEVQEVVPLWRFWNDWNIAEAQMVGYWDAAVPVTTSSPLVKATVYVKADASMLIALANFGNQLTTVTLTFKGGGGGGDIKKIGRKLSARAIEAYQPAREFTLEVNAAAGAEATVVSTGIPVHAKGGWLLETSTGQNFTATALKLDDDVYTQQTGARRLDLHLCPHSHLDVGFEWTPDTMFSKNVRRR